MMVGTDSHTPNAGGLGMAAIGVGGAYEQPQERAECRAAVNYIRNGRYNEALTALSQVPENERDGRWYYLNSVANMYLGNRIAALDSAKRAVELSPDMGFFSAFPLSWNQGCSSLV